MNDDIADRSAARLREGRAWQDFCATMALAGRAIDDFPDASDLERAEWYRFLTRLVRNGCERFVENCEPNRPRMRDTPWRTTINVQSPDQDHFLAEFDEAREYRVSGNRGTIPYFVLAVWSARQPADLAARDWAANGFAGLDEFDPALLQTTAHISSDEIHFDEDGSFTVRLSQTEAGGDWLPLRDDSVGLLLRTVHHRRDEEVMPTFTIERLDGVAPAPVRAKDVSAGLAKTAQFALGYARLVRSWWHDNFAARPNDLRYSRATYLSNGGVPDRHFAFGSWQKPRNLALILQFTPPECEHWIFQLCNIWHENLDNYEDGQGYVTKFTATAEPSGLVRIVIADRDPGIGGNWIDSYEHTRGLMGLRLIKTTAPPPVTAYLVPIEALRASGWDALRAVPAIQTGEVVA
jgi:hypothetical protein